ncbi:MAG: 4-alpha-glucanotransferase [Geodermatophilaceae bacterium]|nr:4-alpha-glucanotransferase [Geodermatophilaceae bacterium]
MTDAWGVDGSYVDSDDRLQRIPDNVVRRLRELVGRPPEDLDARAPLVLRVGEQNRVGRCDVVLEDGTSLPVDATLPASLPAGYHELHPADGPPRPLILSPGRCHLPDGLRVWGWAVQLYAARSRGSWGFGDLADLGLLRDWARRLGAGLLMVNPLHAAAPTLPQEPSPYSPTSRRFANPLYLRPDLLPGFERVDPALAAAAVALNDRREIDRDEVWRLKRPALRAIFDVDAGGDEFARWRREQGSVLREFATWCALADVHGAQWRHWPAQLRHPHAPAVHRFAGLADPEVTFHAWLQWTLAGQLRDATAGLTVIQDLPIGFDPDGADAWSWQDLLAEGVTVGAPPDALNGNGQDWGLPPFVPWKLREAGYRPIIESIRASIAGAGGLRIDHVMGLFRLWWIPGGHGPTEGGYVRYPAGDLLDIVALESQRAGALVVGEDLGVVEAGVRDELARRRMLAYRLLWFAEEEPAKWPELSMGAVTTHDLPTVSGLWSGSDREEQRRYGVDPGDQAVEAMRSKVGVLPNEASPAEATATAYRRLAEAPSALLVATLEDALGEESRPNLPGVATRPNWSLALPLPIDDLHEHPGPTQLARILSADRPPPAASAARAEPISGM